ncbi:MAG: hypothetical protein Q4F95_08130 [Oscillospiraceae bacterium]|nr:hypothetical protein [Oscillospiraceae bacterium]
MQVCKGDLWHTAIADAMHGRITHIPLNLLLWLPYMAKSHAALRLFSVASVVFDMAALYKLVNNITDRLSAYMSCLLFISFACISNQHNLFCAYTLAHQITIGLVFLSLDLFIKYYREPQTKHLIYSALLLFAASFIYEAMVVYIVFFAAAAMINVTGNIFHNLFKILKDLRFHILFMAVFAAAYLFWRFLYPSDYDGAVLYLKNIPGSLLTIAVYSLGMIPGLPFAALIASGKLRISEIPSYFSYEWFIIPVLCTITFYIVLPKMKPVKNRPLMYLMCIAGIILPNIPVGLTSKYISWVRQKSYSYVTSFYSYFFVILLFVLFINGLYHKQKKKKKFVHGVLTAVVFIVSLACSINNSIFNAKFKEQLAGYTAFENAVSDKYFDNVSENAVVYIPDYSGIHNSMETTADFAHIYLNDGITFENDKDKLDFSRPVICMRFDEKTGAMLIGEIDSDFNASSVYVVGDADPSYLTGDLVNMENVF